MNICMMSNNYLPHVGGVARSVHTFTEVYRSMGHKVLVVAPTYPDLEDMEPRVEREVVRVPAMQEFNGSDFSVRMPLLSLMNPRLIEFDADIIHSHHPFLLGDTALRLGADKGVPVIFTHHTLYEEYIHYVPFGLSGMRQFVMELSTHYSNLCDAVVAPSQSIADLIRERGVRVPISVIPTGIDVQSFAGGDGNRFRENHGIPADKFVIGTLGRLAPEKNLGYLSRAVVKFLERVPESVFLVVGAGPSGEEMRKIFAEAGFGDRLLLAGKKTGQELYDAYGAMDLFAFSSFSETQGLVLAEAMAAGLPVVALNASGVREVVRDAENGFLLPAQKGEGGFADKLYELFADSALRERFSENARVTAGEFSREACAAKAIELYERTVQQTRTERSTDEFEDFWNGVRKRVWLEWELFTDKAGLAFDTLIADQGHAREEERRRKTLS